MDNFFKEVYWGNSVLQYLYVLLAIFITWVVFRIIRKIILAAIRKLTGKTSNTYDDAIVSAVEKFIIPYLYLLINYGIVQQLKFSVRSQRILEVAFTMVSVYYLVRAINHLMHFSIRLYLRKKEETETRIRQFDGMLWVIKAVIWMLGFLFFLDNIGYSVTTIITGLGIGGIAIALAAQNILSDLFSYFVIFLDKPFEIGDAIVIGNKSGTVEKIGFKTSRVRSPGGEELIIPNAELVKSTINNFKRLQRRRIVFNIRVAYNTGPEVLKEIPGILRNAVEKSDNILFDRAHLAALFDSYISFEVVYTVLSDDYNLYMDIQQAIFLDIITAFKQKEIAFALPTQMNVAEKSGDEMKQIGGENVVNSVQDEK